MNHPTQLIITYYLINDLITYPKLESISLQTRTINVEILWP